MRSFLSSSITAFSILSLVAGCETHRIGENTALIRTWIELLNKHDTVAIANMYSDSAHLESPNWEGIKTGPAEIKTVYARYFSGTPDLHHLITHLITTDSSIVVEYISEGTFMNPENGSQKNYFDQVAFLKQVGFFDPH